MISDYRIPPDVRLQISQKFLLSKKDSSLTIAPIRFDKAEDVYIYSFTGYLNGACYDGVMQEVKFAKGKNQSPSDIKNEKSIIFSFKVLYCCSNHPSSHCAKDQTAAADSTTKNGCKDWQVKIL